MASPKHDVSHVLSKDTQHAGEASSSPVDKPELLSVSEQPQTAQQSSVLSTETPTSAMEALSLDSPDDQEIAGTDENSDDENNSLSDDLILKDRNSNKSYNGDSSGEEFVDDDYVIDSDESSEHGFDVPQINVRAQELPANKIEHETEEGDWLTSDDEDLSDGELLASVRGDPRFDRNTDAALTRFVDIMMLHYKNSIHRRHETDEQIKDVEDLSGDTDAFYCLLRDEQGNLELQDDGKVYELDGSHVADVKVKDGHRVMSRKRPHMPRLRRLSRDKKPERQQDTTEDEEVKEDEVSEDDPNDPNDPNDDEWLDEVSDSSS